MGESDISVAQSISLHYAQAQRHNEDRSIDDGVLGPSSKRAKIYSDIEIDIVQGSERRGGLRSNDRAMIVELTFPHLSAPERRKWLSALQGSDTSEKVKIDLALTYDDCDPMASKRRGQYPERVRLVKFDSAVKKDSDVIMLWDNSMTLVREGSSFSLEQQPRANRLTPFFKVSDEHGVLCIRFKLATNITSKSHNDRKFRFVVNAEMGSANLLDGFSFDFELVAKHRTEQASGRAEQTATSIAPPCPLFLTKVITDENLVSCFGSSQAITDTGVIAELFETLEPESDHQELQLSRTRKRRRASTRRHALKKIPGLSRNGKFVTQMPDNLPDGVYQIRANHPVHGESNLRSFHYVAPQLSSSDDDESDEMQLDQIVDLFPLRQSDQLCPNHSPQNSHNTTEGASVVSGWPERKESYPDELLPDVVEFETPTSTATRSLLDLVPSNSEMALGYLKPGSCQTTENAGARINANLSLGRQDSYTVSPFGSQWDLGPHESNGEAGSIRRQPSTRSLSRQQSTLSVSRFFASDDVDSKVIAATA